MRCGARICLSRAREARAEPWATCADEAAEPPSHPATAQETHPQGPYNVRVALHTAGPGAVALTAAFDKPGKYDVMLPVPTQRGHGSILLTMTDASGMRFSDEFTVTFHTRAHRLLKWVVLLPFSVAVAVVLAGNAPNSQAQAALLPGGGGSHAD